MQLEYIDICTLLDVSNFIFLPWEKLQHNLTSSIFIMLYFNTSISGPAPNKRGNLGPVPAPVARGCQGPLNNSTCLIRGLRNPATMTMEQGGEGGRKGQGPETSKQPAGRLGPAEQGSAERPRKYSPIRRESRGTRTVVRGKG